VDAAADFILAINAGRRSDSGPASDACFSISDHLQLVERRLLRLATLDQSAPHAADARRFVFVDLKRAWEAVRGPAVREALALGFHRYRTLDEANCCLSPSDFGFQNALATGDGRLVFLDFEYAGKDDPAKLVLDFFCQPQVPVPLSHLDRFMTRLAPLPLDD